jgi:hypothetical protein
MYKTMKLINEEGGRLHGFVKIGFTGWAHFTDVRNSVPNNGVPRKKSISFPR